jgi:hydroxymethylpyrimidine/phosphomethylpyrimidine kinase
VPVPVALTIAGSDPSGGAGIQADLKTFHQFDVYGEAVVTLLTVQNTLGVDRVECLDPQLVREQIRAVVDDIPPAAAKTGALGTDSIVKVVAEEATRFRFPLVVDPVMISKHGVRLMSEDGVQSITRKLAAAATLFTPNIPEAEALTGMPVHDLGDMRRAAECLARMGARAVLIKGGHLRGNAVDLLFTGSHWREYDGPRLDTRHTHGTGCTYSAAITAQLARGLDVEAAVEIAKTYVTRAIGASLELGHGYGPVNHHARRI